MIKPNYTATKQPVVPEQASPGMAWRDIAASAYYAYKASSTARFEAVRPGMPWQAFEDLTEEQRVAWEAAVRQVGACLDTGRAGDEERWAGWRPPVEGGG